MESHSDRGKWPPCRRPASQCFPPVIQKARVLLGAYSRQCFQGQSPWCSSIAPHCTMTLAECDSAGEETHSIIHTFVLLFSCLLDERCPDAPLPNYHSSSDRIGLGSFFSFSFPNRISCQNYVIITFKVGGRKSHCDSPLLWSH